MKISNIFNIILFICIQLILSDCMDRNKPKGFLLQRFEIIDIQLDSLVSNFINENANKKESEAIIIILRIFNCAPEFIFTITPKEYLSESFIYENTKRIVGFIELKNEQILLLSNESNKTEFEMDFYKFILPTQEQSCIPYVYFPEMQYNAYVDGTPYPPSIFDPKYYYFAYKDGQMVSIDYDKPVLIDSLECKND